MPDGELHGRPTAAELVEAVREFLVDEVMPAADAELRFHARVAANALATVERELTLGESQARAHAQALDRLGVASEAELAAAIRSGALDDRADEVLDTVRATVRARLEVANPDHLG
jgi:hypothetical protein